jgi:tetratricopeptide (TPR) repeat protein
VVLTGRVRRNPPGDARNSRPNAPPTVPLLPWAWYGFAVGANPVRTTRDSWRAMAGDQAEYDVFFSHTRADLGTLQPALDALRAAGLRVFQDAAEISEGEHITARLRDGLARSRLFLAWYSKTYPTRRACQWELTTAWLAAEAPGTDGIRPRLLVVNPEPGTEHLQPLDLRGRLWPSGGVPKPAALVAEVRRRLALVRGPLAAVRSLAPPPWYGSNMRLGSARFVGRVADLWAVHSGLLESREVAVSGAPAGGSRDLALVQGMGGNGKTLLAEEYALRFGPGWPGGVFWLSAAGGDRSTALVRIGLVLGLDPESLKADRLEGMLKAKLKDHPPYLWVVDDLPPDASAEDLVAWRAPTPTGATLVTTRNAALDLVGCRIRLGSLDRADALDLLTRRRPPATEVEQAAAEAILTELDNHPLAVDVAGAAVARRGYATFLQDLRNPGRDAMELAARFAGTLPANHAPQIAVTLLSSIARLEPEALRVLQLAAMLAPEPIPNAFIAAVFAVLADYADEGSLQADLGIDGTTTEALAERIPGATAEADSLRVHILVSRTLRFHAGPLPEALEQAALAVFNRVFAAGASDIREHAPLLPLVPHARALIGAAEDEIRANLLGWLGRVAGERGDYRDAAADFRQQSEARCRLLGPEHPATLTSMNNLAENLRAMGGHPAARALEEQVLEARRRVLGPKHPATLTSMNNLAATLGAMGDDPAARALHEQVLEARRRVLGPEHPATLTSMNNLALTLSAMGDYAGARALQEQVLAALRRVLGPEHPNTLASMNNLAETLRAMGDHAGARALQEQLLEARSRVLGPEHPETLVSMGNLASTLGSMGDHAGAQKLQEQVLEAHRRVLGPEHPDTLTSMNNLASTLWSMGDHAGARTIEEQVLEIRRRVLGPEHPDTLTSMNNLASTLWSMGDHAGARTIEEQVLEIRRRVLGPEHPDTLNSMGNLASTLWSMGDHAGARTLQEQVLEARRRVLGPEHPATLTSMHNLAVILLHLEEFEPTLQLIIDALPIALEKHGPNLPISQALLMLAGQLGQLRASPSQPHRQPLQHQGDDL